MPAYHGACRLRGIDSATRRDRIWVWVILIRKRLVPCLSAGGDRTSAYKVLLGREGAEAGAKFIDDYAFLIAGDAVLLERLVSAKPM